MNIFNRSINVINKKGQLQKKIIIKNNQEKDNDDSYNQDLYNEKIQNIRDYAEEQFDRLIVYLNSGALVLTIGFVKDIVKITETTDKILLIFSWCLFAGSLILILLSHQTAAISMNYFQKDNENASDKMDILTKILNWTSFFALIAGIVCFIIFISNQNLK